MPILTPLSTIWGPTWSHLGPNFAHLVPNFVENSDRIAPNMPGRTRRPLQITIFLDFGPLQATIFNDFGYILQVFQALFCTLRPTSDLFFRRLWATIFIHLGTVLLYMFRKVFCVPCAISFDLLQNRLDLDLVLRRSIGEACSIRRPPCGARACWTLIKIDFIKFQSLRLCRRPCGFGGVDRLSWLILPIFPPIKNLNQIFIQF